MTRPANLIPFLVACVGIAGFSLMDALMKEASIAIGALSALFWRNLIGTGMAFPYWLASRGKRPGIAALKLHIGRGLVVALMAFLFFWALVRLPMAEAIAISFVAPVIALFLAALLLGEKIGRSAWLASLFGTMGVTVIMAGRLNGDYDSDALLAVAAVFISAALFAYNLILARQQAQLSKPAEIAFFQCLFITFWMLPVVFWVDLPGDGNVWAGLTGAAGLSIVALATLGWAYARAEAQILIPVEYTAFIWAMLFGWLFFAEKPGLPILAGAALIVTGSVIAARAKPEIALADPQQI